MKIAVLFNRLGPYHHSRLLALSRKVDTTAIEFSTVDDTYAWDTVEGANDYSVISLFTDADIEAKRADEIKISLHNALDQLCPTAVAIPGWSSTAALLALSWCLKTRTPAILMSASTAHDEERRWWKEMIKSRIVRMFSAAVVGGAPQIAYTTELGLPQELVYPGYDVVDNHYFRLQAERVRLNANEVRNRYGLPNKYFLVSSRFILKKNLTRLLRAYSDYVFRTGDLAWSLVILGDGPLKGDLIELVNNLNLEGLVQFRGFVQYSELPIYYGLGDAYIQASTTEQWGLAVNEAMASGLPVLVSNRCGCAPDLVREGKNGFTFDPFDQREITAKMLRLSMEQGKLASMGWESLEIIRRWSPDIFAGSMLKAVSDTLALPTSTVGLLDKTLLSFLVQR